jgi:hypothetical protein
VMTDDGRDRFDASLGSRQRAAPGPDSHLRERLLRPSQPDPGASLAVYPGLPETAVELIKKTIGGDGLPKMN